MEERNDREHRPKAEGVRIIGAEEAQAALDAGQAAGRRPDDEPKFGDVPPAPSGPRSPHRFPLPDSVDPAEAVPHPPVVAPVRGDERPGALRVTRPVAPDERPPRSDDTSARGPSARPGDWRVRSERRSASGGRRGFPVVSDVTDSEPGEPPASEIPPRAPDMPPEHLDLPPHPTDPEATADPGAPERYEPVVSPPAAASTLPAPGAPGAPRSEPPIEAPPERWAAFAAGAGTAQEPVTAEEQAVVAHPLTGSGAEEPRRGEGPSRQVEGTDPVAPPGAGREWTPPRPAAAPDPRSVGATAAPDEPMSFADEPQPTGERITLSGHNSPELPHWTDPPTGEVPRILADDPHAREDDLRAWQALGSRGLRWRDEASDWDVEALPDLGSEETRVGALDTTRTEHSDLYSFDEAFERLEEERSGAHPAVAPLGLDPDAEDAVAAPPPPRSRTRRPPPAPRRRRPARPGAPPARGPGGPPSGGRNLASAVGVGVGLVVLLLILYAVGPAALLVLSALVIGAASAEGYGMLQRAGFRPATLLGLVSAVAIVFAAYWRGVDALPLVVVLTFAASMLWYLLGIVEARPLANVAVTNLMFVWVGVLGSFAALMLRAHDGKGLFLGAVVVAVGSDIAAFFAGSSVGNRQMAPEVSPGKTWEGAVAGFVAAIVVGAIVGKTLAPWGGIKHGLVLGVIVGIVAPIGDLAESMVKRDLGLKDSGSALPGHGGLLDRFDSILLILPAAYYLATYTHILK